MDNITLNSYELFYLLLSIFLLFLGAHIFGSIFQKLNLPRVIGEIVSGIILGPSCLQAISPTFIAHIFSAFPGQEKILSFLYWMGLLLLMTLSGTHINYTDILKNKKEVFVLFISATVLPSIGGIIYYFLYDFNQYIGPLGSKIHMCLIVCIAISVTSLPVISKIFIDLRMMHSAFAKIIIATATIQDIFLWGILGIFINSSYKAYDHIQHAILTITFISAALYCAWIVTKKYNGLSRVIIKNYLAFPIIFGVFFIVILISSLLGINVIFGAMMFGIILGTIKNKYISQEKNTILNFAQKFFIPLYFSIVGLKINLPGYFDLYLVLSFGVISSILEIASVSWGVKKFTQCWKHSLTYGIAMNTRGGPGIVLACLTFEAQLINQSFFVMLVIIAIVTSLCSGIWFRYIRNTPKLLAPLS